MARHASPAVGHPDTGEASTQFVILVPVMFVLCLAVVQIALWFHTANVAESAAARGAAAGSYLRAGAADAAAAAMAVIGDNGAVVRTAPTVDIGTDRVSVSVTLAVPKVVPFFPDSVRRTQIEPKERFVPEGER